MIVIANIKKGRDIGEAESKAKIATRKFSGTTITVLGNIGVLIVNCPGDVSFEEIKGALTSCDCINQKAICPDAEIKLVESVREEGPF